MRCVLQHYGWYGTVTADLQCNIDALPPLFFDELRLKLGILDDTKLIDEPSGNHLFRRS
jgi:hypothetical protein